MNTNNDTPRLSAPKVTFPGKESLLKPVVHRSAIWVRMASVAASIILLVGGVALFWSDSQSPSPEPKTPSTFAQAMLAEPSAPVAPTQVATPEVHKKQLTKKITTKTEQTKAIIKPNTARNDTQKTIPQRCQMDDKQHKKLIATIINPAFIIVNAEPKASPIDTKVPQQSYTAFNLPKFRTVTVFEDIKKSIIEQVQEAPLGQIIMSARKIVIDRDQKSNELHEEDYIL